MTEIEKKDARFTRDHNRLLDTKYKNYNMIHINPGCCSICGEYHCTNEFCKNHNFQQLMGFVKYLGLNPQTIGTIKIFEEFNRIRNMIYDLYWNKEMSTPDLGKKFGYPDGRMQLSVFKELGVPIRDKSKSIINAYKQNKLFPPTADSGYFANLVSGPHITWEGSEVFLRSSYELDYAEYLDNSNISYSVESLRIEYYDSQQNKTRIAIPDFYITDTNTIVEIKSDFTLDIQEMLDKFDSYKKLGYETKLILEGKEVNIYNIENEVDEATLNRIKRCNISSLTARKP
jgi:hypothetical protein